MIEDTSKRPAELHLLGSLSEGSGGYITGMEAAGQRQLVGGESLPIEAGGDAAYESLGFVFGEKEDDLFRKATLPAGWTKQRTDHSMWSKIVDEHGRERVSIFYKAAFYDRSAFMRIQTVYGYVSHLLHHGGAPVFDDQWCTREAWAAAVAGIREERVGYIEVYASCPDPSDYDLMRVSELRAEIVRLDEMAALA